MFSLFFGHLAQIYSFDRININIYMTSLSTQLMITGYIGTLLNCSYIRLGAFSTNRASFDIAKITIAQKQRQTHIT